MAVGTAGAVLLAAGGFSAASQVMGANTQAKSIQRQAEYNAQIYEQQAEMIREKKKIQDSQFIRNAARARGAIVSRAAGKGFMLGGSPAAILIDTESQMQFDKAIEDYNLKVEENFALSGASYMRQTGAAQSRLARYSGYTNAFSTLLNTGVSAAMLGPGVPRGAANKSLVISGRTGGVPWWQGGRA